MCIQSLHQHTCHHNGLGPLIPCFTIYSPLNPQSTTSTPANHITRPITLISTPCPFCLNPLIPRTAPVSIIDPRATFPFNSIIYIPPSNPAFASVISYPVVFPVQYSQQQPQPPAYQPQKLHGLFVPLNTSREIRQEMVGGRLVDVEHFHFGTSGNCGRHGYNAVHGYDTGPLPPGWGPTPAGGNEIGRPLDLAISAPGNDDEIEAGQEGEIAGPAVVREAVVRRPAQPTAAQPAAAPDQQVRNAAPQNLAQLRVLPANQRPNADQQQRNAGAAVQAPPEAVQDAARGPDLHIPN